MCEYHLCSSHTKHLNKFSAEMNVNLLCVHVSVNQKDWITCVYMLMFCRHTTTKSVMLPLCVILDLWPSWCHCRVMWMRPQSHRLLHILHMLVARGKFLFHDQQAETSLWLLQFLLVVWMKDATLSTNAHQLLLNCERCDTICKRRTLTFKVKVLKHVDCSFCGEPTGSR